MSRNRFAAALLCAGALLLSACSAAPEETAAPTIETNPVTFEDTGIQVIHAGYYQMTEKTYYDRADTVKSAKKLVPDKETVIRYNYSGQRIRKTCYGRNDTEAVFLEDDAYSYDESGNTVRVESYDASGSLVSTAEKKEDGWHEYDADGNEIAARMRDDYGNLMEKTADDGSRTVETFNQNDRVTSREKYGADNALQEKTVYSYDANDHIPDSITITDAGGTVTSQIYLMRGTMRKNEIYSRYYGMDDTSDSICDVTDTYDKDSGLLVSSLAVKKEDGSTMLTTYEYE